MTWRRRNGWGRGREILWRVLRESDDKIEFRDLPGDRSQLSDMLVHLL